MAERMIWKGAIAFGLVEIPVGLVAAEIPSEIKLSYIDRRDFSPVGYNRYNKATGDEVPWPEIVRGYEHQAGEYVVLSEADLRRANPKLTQTVNILHFVDGSEIEPIYYEKPYYLEPLKKSKGYVLLRETLRRTGKVGIAKIVVRTKEHIAAVGVRENALVLYLLRFAQEIRSTKELDNIDLDPADVKIQPKEIEMAKRLVEDMVVEWDPEAYTDEYATELMQVIEEKIDAGEMHTLTPDDDDDQPRKRGEIIDLMPLLAKSIDAARQSLAPARRKPAAPAPRRTKRAPAAEKRAPAEKRTARRRTG